MFLGKWITLDSSRDLWVTPVTVSLGEVQEDEFVTDRIEAETEGWGGGGTYEMEQSLWLNEAVY